MKIVIDIDDNLHTHLVNNRELSNTDKNEIISLVRKGILSQGNPYIVTNSKSLDPWNLRPENMWTERINITNQYRIM